jgi:guanidinobutyrase
VDAHADVNDTMNGEKIAHGTPFRRAFEEGLLDPRRVVQIGLRGTGYHADDFDWCRAQGFRVVQAEECWHRSLVPLMEEVRADGRRAGLSHLRYRWPRSGLSRPAPARRKSAG